MFSGKNPSDARCSSICPGFRKRHPERDLLNPLGQEVRTVILKLGRTSSSPVLSPVSRWWVLLKQYDDQVCWCYQNCTLQSKCLSGEGMYSA